MFFQIALPTPLAVKEGDYLGFSWLNSGAVAFEYVSEQNYCENNALFNEGDTANLVSGRHGKRVYSIWASLYPYPTCA